MEDFACFCNRGRDTWSWVGMLLAGLKGAVFFQIEREVLFSKNSNLMTFKIMYLFHPLCSPSPDEFRGTRVLLLKQLVCGVQSFHSNIKNDLLSHFTIERINRLHTSSALNIQTKEETNPSWANNAKDNSNSPSLLSGVLGSYPNPNPNAVLFHSMI